MISRKTNIPPLLEPYLRLPREASLLLLTGVLNATPHWLTTRVLRGAFGDSTSHGRNARPTPDEERPESVNNDDIAVVLVSWLRDWEFWKGEARRGAGLDLARLAQDNRFAFVDGPTGIFSSPSMQSPTPPTAQPQQQQQRTPQPSLAQRNPIPNRTLPIRGAGPLPSRGPPPSASTTPAQPSQPQPQPQPTQQTQTPPQKNLYTLTTSAPFTAESSIKSAIHALATSSTSTPKRVLLILDSPTTPMALQPASSISATSVSNLVLSLRSEQHVYATVLSLETDGPFLAPATLALHNQLHNDTHNNNAGVQDTVLKSPLETEMSRFIVTQAHAARWVVGVRGLDTGVARDVSGVIRVTRGGGWDAKDEADEDNPGSKAVVDKEMEVLYFVQGDGGVRVFERGGGEIG